MDVTAIFKLRAMNDDQSVSANNDSAMYDELIRELNRGSSIDEEDQWQDFWADISFPIEKAIAFETRLRVWLCKSIELMRIAVRERSRWEHQKASLRWTTLEDIEKMRAENTFRKAFIDLFDHKFITDTNDFHPSKGCCKLTKKEQPKLDEYTMRHTTNSEVDEVSEVLDAQLNLNKRFEEFLREYSMHIFNVEKNFQNFAIGRGIDVRLAHPMDSVDQDDYHRKWLAFESDMNKLKECKLVFFKEDFYVLTNNHGRVSPHTT